MSDLTDLIPTRQTLLSRLRDYSDDDSWKEFFETYWRLMYATAIKAGLTDSEAQDVVQETVISVARKMPQFQYDPSLGSFKGWLLNLTRWRITDQLRRRQPRLVSTGSTGTATSVEGSVSQIPATVQTELDSFWDREWEKNVLESAIEKVKQSVEAKQYQAFDLYVLRDWPATRVAETLHLNIAQVYLIKHRISRMVRKEVDSIRKRCGA